MQELQDFVCYISVICIALLEGVHSSGQLEVLLLRYVNPDGRGDNLNYCDGVFGIKRSDCDHKFDICLDWESNDSPSIDVCDVGFVDTGFVHNMDSIAFNSSIGTAPDKVTANPIIVNFNTWDSMGLRVKVDVTDDDSSNDDDHVELLPPATVQLQLGANARTATPYEKVLAGRTSLTIQVKAYCDQGWYGAACSVHCSQRDDVTGHYTCNPDGSRRCLSGWKGTSCDVVDSVTSAPVVPRVTQPKADTTSNPRDNGAVSVSCVGFPLLLASLMSVVLG